MSSHRPIRRAFTLVEVLMAVAIASVLLLATAAALKASVDSFTANHVSADTLQRARITMMRISQQLRAGSDHEPITSAKRSSFIAGATVTDRGVSFLDDTGKAIEYVFDSTAGTLKIQVNGGAARTLASNVSAFSLRMTPARSATSIKTGGVYDELERVTISLSINPVVDGSEIHGQSVTLTESITPRARLWN